MKDESFWIACILVVFVILCMCVHLLAVFLATTRGLASSIGLANAVSSSSSDQVSSNSRAATGPLRSKRRILRASDRCGSQQVCQNEPRKNRKSQQKKTYQRRNMPSGISFLARVLVDAQSLFASSVSTTGQSCTLHTKRCQLTRRRSDENHHIWLFQRYGQFSLVGM